MGKALWSYQNPAATPYEYICGTPDYDIETPLQGTQNYWISLK